MSVSESRAEDMRMDLGVLLGSVLSRWLRIILVTAIALGATFAVLLFIPKLYESSTSLLVEQRANAFTRSANEVAAASSITQDSLMSSQIELIKSRDNLLAVVDQLNLRDVREFGGAAFSPINFVLQLIGRKPEVKSGDQTVIENLGERVTVVRERDSAVITIYVRSQDPQLAADIANAIAANHVKRRADLSLSDTASASGWLEQEIAKLRSGVQEAETAVANYRVDNDLFAGANNVPVRDQQLSVIAGQITAAQERKNSAQSRATLIRGLIESGQPIDGVPDVRNSLVIQNLIQSQATLQGELAQRSSTLLANHPTIKAITAQIGAIQKQIAAEGRKVAESLEAGAKIEADLEQSLNDDMTRMKLSVSTATRDTVTLESLQRDAKAQRDLLESYLARYSDAAARTDSSSTLPDVRIVNFAAASVEPASPKVGLVLGAVGFVALALQVGSILFGELMSGRAISERRYAVAEDDVQVDEDADEPDLFTAIHHAPPAPQSHPFAEAVSRHGERHPQPEPVVATAPEPIFEEPVAPEPAPAPVAVAAPVEPIREPEPIAPETLPRGPGAAALELSSLAADIAIGRVRVVILAALSNFRDVEIVAETLAAGALGRGLSVATIDAGSGRLSDEAGLTDLAADRVSFGDVVHKVGEGLASVPWGHQDTLERRSMKPVTLIEALTDIYEVVIVSTGRIGVTSALPVFTGVDCRLVLVAGDHADRATVQATLAEAATLGYEVGQMVAAPPQRSVA